MTEATPALPSPPSPFAGSDWFDPLEAAVRGQVRAFIEQLLEEELEAALGRERYERGAISNGRRHGHFDDDGDRARDRGGVREQRDRLGAAAIEVRRDVLPRPRARRRGPRPARRAPRP